MAANLTPQYLEAEEQYRKAKSPDERLTHLQTMYRLMPKHKASEKLQRDLKTRMRECREDLEKGQSTGKKGGTAGYKIPRQGAGQFVILGGPNAGKSRLLSRLTRATPEVAPYPFTTREPVVGMTEFGDVKIQLIDLPPVTADALEPFVTNLTRRADAALLLLDLADDDGPFALEAVVDKLAGVKTVLVGEEPMDIGDFSVESVKTMVVANKSDDAGAADRLEIAREMFADKFPIHVVAAEPGTGLDELKRSMFEFLRIIRVFTKEPGKPADKTNPYTCPVGSTVAEFAGRVHRDLEAKCKSARVWGSAQFDGQTVGRDHVLNDLDVVELHS